MKFNKTFTLAILMLSLLSCKKESKEECCFEPAGAAEYYINNKSNKDLKITLTTSFALGETVIDTIPNIVNSANEKIFEDGGIGINPNPEYSFQKIEIVDSNDSGNQIVISTVNNSDWTILSQDLGTTGYGLTIYELEIDNNSFE